MDFELFKTKSIEEQITSTIHETRRGNSQYLQWFCDIYKSPDYGEKLIPVFYHPTFFSFVLQETSNEFPLEFVTLLRLFARRDGFEEQISSHDGIRNLCRLIQKTPNNTEIVDSACIVIGLLATNVQTRSTLTEEGAITILVELLKNPTSNSRCITLTCRALNNACYKMIENKIAFVEAGGFCRLIALFESDINNEAKQTAALLLRNICNLDEDRAYLTDTVQTVVDDLLSVLQNDVPETQVHLLWAVLNLTINNGSLKRQLGERGGCERILGIMKSHFGNAKVQTVACTALLQLSRKQYNHMAIGKAGGVTRIVLAIKQHSGNVELLEIAIQVLDVLCTKGVNRKRLTKEKGLLEILAITLRENISQQRVVSSILEIIQKIAKGAARSKQELRLINILPILTSVINHYSSVTNPRLASPNSSNTPSIRLLANNIISDLFKPSLTDEEDSDESFSSSSDDEPDTNGNANVSADPGIELDGDIEFSIQSLKKAIDAEQSTSDLMERYNANLKMKEELINERSARKRLEEEVCKLKSQLREAESKTEKHLELLSLNQQLSADLEVAQQHITDLIVQNQTYSSDIKSLESQFETDIETIRLSEQKRAQKEISRYKLELEEKDRTLEKFREEREQFDRENQKMEKLLENTVEDRMLFHWMTLAIRLDYTMHNRATSSDFDKATVYEQLKTESVSVGTWPKRILDEILGSNGIRANGSYSTSSSTRRFRQDVLVENLKK